MILRDIWREAKSSTDSGKMGRVNDRSMFRSVALLTLVAALPCAAAVSGQAVYQRRCAACHDSGSETAPPRDALKQLSVARILRTLDFGVMVNIANPLDREEREAVASYLGVERPDAPVPQTGLLRRPHSEHRRVAESCMERLGARPLKHALRDLERHYVESSGQAQAEVGLCVSMAM